jgi:hypothetical protein
MGIIEVFKLCTFYLPVFLLGIRILLLLLNWIFQLQRDPKEPLFIKPKIPFIGHLIGLTFKKTGYYVELRYITPLSRLYFANAHHNSMKSKLRIYGLLMPGMAGTRVYIINSPNLVVAVQRQHNVLSFWSVAAAFTSQLAGLSYCAEKTLVNNSQGEEGKPSLMRTEMENAHTSFRLGGKFLSTLQRAALEILAPSIVNLEEQIGTTIELKSMVGNSIMESVTGSIFGENNPFEDLNLRKDFE